VNKKISAFLEKEKKNKISKQKNYHKKKTKKQKTEMKILVFKKVEFHNVWSMEMTWI